MTAIAVVIARRHPALIVGWLWFLGTLIPVIGIVQVGVQSMADRYSYFPHVGFFMAIVFTSLSVFSRGRGTILVVFGIVLLSGLAYQTHHALRHWRNSESLYRRALQVTDNNWVIHTNLGVLLKARGEHVEADEHFIRAVDINPASADTHYHVAETHVRAGRFREAIAALDAAIAINPDMVPALNDLAWILATQADPTLRDGPRALVLAERACNLHGREEAALLDTLAAAYATNDRFEDAVKTAEHALGLALQTGQPQLAAAIQKHLQDFREARPVREGRP
jgi:tetratricopeptide (TPR) repeat protein